MKTSRRNLHYTLIPLSLVPSVNIVTLWLVTYAGKDIGFVASSHMDQLTATGRHATPLRWGYACYTNGHLSDIKFMHESREDAGHALKEVLLDKVA